MNTWYLVQILAELLAIPPEVRSLSGACKIVILKQVTNVFS